MRRLLRSRWALAVLALAFTFAYPMQVNGFNQNSHYALVRALAVHHVPHIDESLTEIGEVSTGDVSRYQGHWYAAKAPGLAIASVPAFFVAEAVGMRTVGDPTRIIWALHLWSIVVPAVLLLVCVRWLGDRLEPGFGAAAAITLGVATLVLPFATLFFAHVLAAALGFAAFALLRYERDGPPRRRLVALAGLAAALAVFVDYPLVFVGAVVGLYALARGDVVRRGLAYTGGVALGLIPLAAFNWWAFGTPFHIAYEEYYTDPEHAGRGVFGFGLPSGRAAGDLLFSSMGIVTLTPVLVCGVAGAVLLARRHRAEALAILGVVAVYLLYNSSLRYNSPFGGLGPPRYLIPLVPFAALPLVLAFRAFPLTTIALGLVSGFQMVVMTATGPLAAYDGEWLDRLRGREFVQTAASLVDVTGWYSIAPYFLAVLVAVACAVAVSARPALRLRDLGVAAAALAAWAAVAASAANPNGQPPSNAYVAAAVVAAGGAVAVLALIYGTAGRGLPLRAAGSSR